MRKRKCSIILSVITFALLLGIGFADALLNVPPVEIPSSFPSYYSDCDYCGQSGSSTHYDMYVSDVTCPDCGTTWEEVQGSFANGSSECREVPGYSSITKRCSTCQRIHDMKQRFNPPPRYNPPPPPPSNKPPTAYAWSPEVPMPSIAQSDITLPKLLLRLPNLCTPRALRNQSPDVWLKGWDLWYNGTPSPRKELPEDLKFRIENDLGVHV